MRHLNRKRLSYIRIGEMEFVNVIVVFGIDCFHPEKVFIYPYQGRPFPVAIFPIKDFWPQVYHEAQ